MSIRLSVNIDHVATLRQVRSSFYPDPVQAAFKAIKGGADGITLHLCEDRRHIQDADVAAFKEMLNVPMNLEITPTEELLSIAESVQPAYVSLVPENRRESQAQNGIDVISHQKIIVDACTRLIDSNIQAQLFVGPSRLQIDAALACGVSVVELHTGAYANATSISEKNTQLKRIIDAAEYANHIGLIVKAGHGLHIENVQAIAAIPQIVELNIGHSIIARALFIGLQRAVEEMKALMLAARTIEAAT